MTYFRAAISSTVSGVWYLTADSLSVVSYASVHSVQQT